MGFHLRDTDHGWKARLKGLLALKAPAHIDVGILESAGVEKDGTSVIDVAEWNEFGTATIPERSFIRAWFDEAEPQLRQDFAALMRTVAAGKRTRAEVLELMGQRMVGQVQARMSAGIPPPNAPSTVRRKGSSTPLIDTGVLRSSVTYRTGGG